MSTSTAGGAAFDASVSLDEDRARSKIRAAVDYHAREVEAAERAVAGAGEKIDKAKAAVDAARAAEHEAKAELKAAKDRHKDAQRQLSEQSETEGTA